MAVDAFKDKQFSPVYHKFILPSSSEVMNIIVTYLKKKKGLPLDLAVDVGCGTGRYTVLLAIYFRKVLGCDISDSQIHFAQKYSAKDNVTYMVAAAEKMPLQDASVDLVTAGLAVHWFDSNEFYNEAIRVLTKNGCLAFHAFNPYVEIDYKDVSQDLTDVITWGLDTFKMCGGKEIKNYLESQYQRIYEAVPLEDKEWITDIPVQTSMSMEGLLGFLQAVCWFQIMKEKDPEGSKHFLSLLEKRFRDILGEDADFALLNVKQKCFCVLACKH
ncbi:uncharacterized protein [Hyperolius riggenbachi]|uniref:uncharacterized protein n=1 Tax=Hyperolius riggenbachi TaxID=752182 RepID=UPI0035A3BD78